MTDRRSSCQIIYDAGSSGTRLFIYELTGAGWLAHRGPETDALADPVRSMRGKTMSDVDGLVDSIVSALEDTRTDGPLDERGRPQWLAFDWKIDCKVDAAAVYATAGMRLAEQQDPQASKRVWKTLNDRLSSYLGMPVTTRTLTGYEEGLYAWLGAREVSQDGNFGLAEMGGASLQVTFPCPDCKTARTVRAKNRQIPMFSHSFLGLGQDEAWRKLEPLPACERGVGLGNPDWTTGNCAARIPVSPDEIGAVRDQVPDLDGFVWYLAGAFRYMEDSDIDQFCRLGVDSGFQPETSCFRAVYLEKILDSIGIPQGADATDTDWTLGAVVCTLTQCLEQAGFYE